MDARDKKLRGTCYVMTNPLEDEEEYDGWKDNLPLDDHYEVDYLRDKRYNWVYNSLGKQERAQENRQKNQTVALNNSNQLISVVITNSDL